MVISTSLDMTFEFARSDTRHRSLVGTDFIEVRGDPRWVPEWRGGFFGVNPPRH